MLYDLNIAWSPTTPAPDLERTLRFSVELGYNVVALNQILSSPIPFPVVNPIPVLGPTSPYHPKATPSKSPAHNGTSQPSSRKEVPVPMPTPTILRRATVLMADPGANFRLAALAGAYDMLALRPTTEKAFNFACLNATEASLISLDLTTSFPFYFKPKPCMAAVRRGTRFEVCYGQVLDPGADSRRRAAFVGNLMGLVRATKGRGLVVSSEARSVLGLRGPADVVNLLAVWGLSTDKGTEAIGVNPRGVVVNEGLKRRSFRGVIDVVKPADKAESASAEGPGTADASKGIAAKQQAPRASTASGEKNLKAAAGDKRKREAGASGDSDDPPKISKRQAKKLKAAGKTAGGSHQEPK